MLVPHDRQLVPFLFCSPLRLKHLEVTTSALGWEVGPAIDPDCQYLKNCD